MPSARLVCMACGQANRVPLSRVSEEPKCGTCGQPLASGLVAEVDGATHDKAVRQDELPLIVDYWAPWCGPCRMMAPAFAAAASTLAPRVRFAKINTDTYPAISQRLGIRGIPLLILYDRGREVARLPGARPASDIVEFVRTRVRVPAS